MAINRWNSRHCSGDRRHLPDSAVVADQEMMIAAGCNRRYRIAYRARIEVLMHGENERRRHDQGFVLPRGLGGTRLGNRVGAIIGRVGVGGIDNKWWRDECLAL